MKAFFKTKTVVGLSIGISELALMAFDNSRKKTRIVGYSSLKLDPAKAIASFEQPDSYLNEQFLSLKNQVVGKIDSNYAFVTIPTANTFSRTLQLPTSVKKDLDNAIDLEIEQYIPIPRQMLVASHEIIRQDNDTLDISFSAAPIEIINRTLDLSRLIGLEPISIEPSMNSIARLLINAENGSLVTLIIDIESNHTDLAILDQVVRVSSSIEIGGDNFTTAISQALHISVEKANQLKLLSGLSKSPYQEAISKALQPSLRQITDEIRKIIRYNRDRLNGQNVEQVLVVGLGSNLAGLSDFFINELRLPVRLANPWRDFDFGKLIHPSRAALATYLPAAGTAWLKAKEVIYD